MSQTGHRIICALEMLILLLPLTALFALIATLTYVAYPIPFHPLQFTFDVTMVILAAAIITAWWLVAAVLRQGPDRMHGVHRAWMHLLGLGALLGLTGFGLGVWHMLDTDRAPEALGFILLSPGLALLPVWLHLRRL